MAIKINKYDFGNISEMCDLHRKFSDLEIVSAKTMAYDNAIGMNEIIDMVAFKKSKTLDDVFDLVSQVTGYEGGDLNSDSSEFDSEEENLKQKTIKKAFRYKRYLKAELEKNRHNWMDQCPELVIPIGDIYEIPVKPQFLFVTKKMDGIFEIEAGFYADKKAPSGVTDTQTPISKVMDFEMKAEKKKLEYEKISEERLAGVNLYKDEYLALKYIEKLIENKQFLKVFGLKEGVKIWAAGSVYYMEMKSNDEKITEFFEGTSNVITLGEAYIVGEDNFFHSTELDDIFKDYAKMHALGKSSDKCSKKDCEFCSNRASCGFQKAPEKKKKEVKKASNANNHFEMTKSQKEIQALRSGYNMVNAKAGSGKTAVMVKLMAGILQEERSNGGK